MSLVRVVVVDDSSVVRRMVEEVLAAVPGVEVVGTAPNGRVALELVQRLKPDVMTLDQEMPEMNGLETLEALQRRQGTPKVIMVSTLTEKGAVTTLMALGRGAVDYVTKPRARSLDDARRHLQEQLVPKVLAHGARPASRATQAASPTVRDAKPPSGPPLARRTTPATLAELLVIGASTGGPTALEQIIPRLPPTLAVPVLVVQHMPTLFTKILADRLSAQSSLAVREAKHGDAVEPGRVLIAPGGYHMTLVQDRGVMRIRLDEGPPEHSCRPAVDPMLRSAAAWSSKRTLAVILTGMGQDGFHGCQRIREGGGQILAQDQATSVVWGMPGFVARAGLADAVVPISDVVGEILRRVVSPGKAREVQHAR